MPELFTETSLANTFNTWRINTNNVRAHINKAANTTGVPALRTLNLHGEGNTRLSGANVFITATHTRVSNTIVLDGSNTSILGGTLLSVSNTRFLGASNDFRGGFISTSANTDFTGKQIYATANAEFQGGNTSIRGGLLYNTSNVSLRGANVNITSSVHTTGNFVNKGRFKVLKNSANTDILSKRLIIQSNTVLNGANTIIKSKLVVNGPNAKTTLAGNTTNEGFMKSKTFREQYATSAISSNAISIDLSSAQNFSIPLIGSVTSVTLNNPPPGANMFGFTILFTNDGTQRQITWPSAVKWAGNSKPTHTARNNSVDIFSFITKDAGTTYYAFTAGQDFF